MTDGLIHYVPENQAAKSEQAQLELEYMLQAVDEEGRRSMGAVAWLVAALLMIAVGVVLGVIVVWPLLVGQ